MPKKALKEEYRIMKKYMILMKTRSKIENINLATPIIISNGNVLNNPMKSRTLSDLIKNIVQHYDVHRSYPLDFKIQRGMGKGM